MPNPIGRPVVEESQFEFWLTCLAPFLQNASSLNYAIKAANLNPHRTSIYEKYAKKDWFADVVDNYQREPGELVNDAIVTQVRNIATKIKRSEAITRDDQDMLKFYAEKSRSAQPFFVNRNETAAGAPLDEVLGNLEKAESDSTDDVAREAEKQVVATQPPIQNPEQTGVTGDVPPQPDAAPVQG